MSLTTRAYETPIRAASTCPPALGRGQVRLTDDPATLSNDGPTFSPDVTHVLYTHGDNVAGITTLERLRNDGSDRQTVIFGVGGEFTSTWGG